MKTICTVSMLFLCILALAGTCPGMEFKKVVMYDDQAFVSFDQEITGHISLGAPPEMIPESLVLTPLTGGSVRSVSIEPMRNTSGKARDLKDSLGKKQSALDVLKRDQAMLEKQIDIIYDAAGSKGKATAFDKTHLSDALGFIESRVSGLNSRIVELTRKEERIDLEIKDLQCRLNKVNQNPGYKIDITGNGRLEISYVVRAASWRPEYRVYASPGDPELALETSVQARQMSGVDWDIKEMLVSTGRPGIGIQAPELQPWYLRKARKHPAKLQAEASDTAQKAEAGTIEDAQVPVEATSTSYLIGAAENIHLAGDGTPAAVKISKQALKADFSLMSVPKYSRYAYLRTEFMLKGDAPLVPGPYSSFVDNVYSGRGEMRRFEPGQKISLDLGVDEGVKVERKETQAFRDKTIGGRNRVTYTCEITLENTRSKNALLTVKDQVPVSQDKGIVVDLIKTAPEIQPDQDGILTWSLDLEPHKKAKAVFSYSITGNNINPD
ncbi:MAG TPA: DUF4139 domain-containing protein [Desulfomonilia bacterium]|nr:DUF4139 domain-containing protein [Desulfomonilia bacterium]